MVFEELLDRLASNIALLTGAVATLAESVNGTYAGKPIYAEGAAQNTESKPALIADPKPRGRGRPPKGEASAPTVTAVATSTQSPISAPASAVEADPFATTTVVPTVKFTEDQVRQALVNLKNVTSQEAALKVLKDAGGATNITELKADKYGAVIDAAGAAVIAAGKAAAGTPNAADDPFGETTPVEEVPSLEDIKKLIVETQKRASASIVQSLVMSFGGKAKNPDTGVEGPALSPLPISKYAELAKALKALPTTK